MLFSDATPTAQFQLMQRGMIRRGISKITGDICLKVVGLREGVSIVYSVTPDGSP